MSCRTGERRRLCMARWTEILTPLKVEERRKVIGQWLHGPVYDGSGKIREADGKHPRGTMICQEEADELWAMWCGS